MDFRICPNCFNIVEHQSHDVPFPCSNCQTQVCISDSDSQLAIIIEKSSFTEPTESAAPLEKPYVSDLDTYSAEPVITEYASDKHLEHSTTSQATIPDDSTLDDIIKRLSEGTPDKHLEHNTTPQAIPDDSALDDIIKRLSEGTPLASEITESIKENSLEELQEEPSTHSKPSTDKTEDLLSTRPTYEEEATEFDDAEEFTIEDDEFDSTPIDFEISEERDAPHNEFALERDKTINRLPQITPRSEAIKESDSNYTTESSTSFKRAVKPRNAPKNYADTVDEDLAFVGKNFIKKKLNINKVKVVNAETAIIERGLVEEKLFDLDNRKHPLEEGEGITPDENTDEPKVQLRDSVAKANQKKGKTRKRRGKAFKVLATISTIFILTGLLFLFTRASKKRQEEALQVTIKDTAEQVKEDEYITELIDIDRSKQVLESFLKTQDFREAKKFVLPDENIEKSLEKYWKPIETTKIEYSNATYLPNLEGVIHYFNCSNKNEGLTFRYPVFTIKGEKEPLVDWRYTNQIEDITIEDLVKSKKAGTFRVRCGITLEDYYNHAYKNRNEWLSLSAWDTINFLNTSNNRLDCYLNKKSDLSKVILDQLLSQSGFLEVQGIKEIENTTFEIASSEPLGLNLIYSSRSQPASKSNAKLILELTVTDPKNRVAEITDLVCTSVVDYYERYQKPFLASNKK